ncbi:hypothetical protein HYS48_00560 [Candidatus Woesearchaeota archaeon]|nr:hypothetical protein [Candidatus Woesearchaeota archaeon]
MAKKEVCGACGKLLQRKFITEGLKKFCCQECCDTAKQGKKKKNVCEFC